MTQTTSVDVASQTRYTSVENTGSASKSYCQDEQSTAPKTIGPQQPVKPKLDNRSEAAVLLNRAPILDPLPENALSEKDFIEATQRLLQKKVNNVPDAVKALEKQLQPTGSSGPRKLVKRVFGALTGVFGQPDTESILGTIGPVTANVESVPQNLPVRYYRSTRPEQKFDTTTDNPKLDIDPPAIWVFECTRNGVVQKRVVPCTTGCSVRFVF
jgi:hypothetical protein